MNFGYDRSTPWEKVFLFMPLFMENKIYWWQWAERRVEIKNNVATFQWRVVK